MKVLIACLLASIMVILFVSNVDAASSSSLVLYLTFDDGSANDSSSYGNNGTIGGAPAVVDGKFGKALELNGTSDYVSIPKSESLRFGEGSFTFEAWVNVSADKETGTSGGRLVNDRGTGAGGTLNGWQIKMINMGEGGRWGFNDSGLDDKTGNYKAYNPGFVVTTAKYNNGEWYHVGIVYEAGTGLSFYVNGELDGELEIQEYGSIDNELPVCIGAALAASGVEGTKSQYFPGIVDEVRLWNVALSQAELVDNMTNGLGSSTSVQPSGKLTTTWGMIRAD